MGITLHAIVSALVPIVAVATLMLLPRRNPSWRRVLFCLAGVAVAMGLALEPHKCFEGLAVREVLVSGIAAFLVFGWTRPDAWRRIIGGGLLVAMFGLSYHFTEVVHQPGWTGNPDWAGAGTVVLASVQRSLASRIGEMADPDAAVEAGWLRDLPVAAELGMVPSPDALGRRVIRRAWHSWLTGLYSYTEVPQDIWYPGGPLRTGVIRIELRDRRGGYALTRRALSAHS